MAITHKCTQAPARGRSGLAQAIAKSGKREFYVVVDGISGVNAVIIPASLQGKDLLIAGSVGPTGKFSKALTELWGRGDVWGCSGYIDIMEALGNPPFPRHTVCTLS